MGFKRKVLFYGLKNALIPRFRSRADLEAYQQRKLQAFAQTVLRHSPFYARFFKGANLDWEAVPQITKTEFMAYFDEINTCQIRKEEAMAVALGAEKSRNFKTELNGITIGLSTGTSGKRGIFLVSEDERAKWVALVMKRVIQPKLFQKQKVAFFLRANSNLYASVQSSLFEFRYFDLFKPLPELVAELAAYQPDILASQPSLLVDLAQAQRENRLSIAPKQVISFAEVLHEADKRRIEATFRVPITEVYQCTEGFLGVTCPHGTMHLNEDFIHFDQEWIDETHFFPIVTDFSRSSQPVVKYKLSDVLEVKKTPCACGDLRLAIERIVGRDDDVLILKGIRVYPDLVARRIAQTTDDFSQYRIVQTAENQLTLGIACDAADFEALKTRFITTLDALFASFGIEGVQYQVENRVEQEAGTKMRKIKRVSYEP